MRELDCLGDICPVPVMKLMQMKALGPGESVKLITDHSCSTQNVMEYCEKHGLRIEISEPITGVWELIVSRPLA